MIDSLSDEQLLEIANYYITTDESLDKFQSKAFKKHQNSATNNKLNSMKAKLELIGNMKPLPPPMTYIKEIKYVPGPDSSNKNTSSSMLMNNASNLANKAEEKMLRMEEPKQTNVKKAVSYYNHLNVSK